MEIFGVGTMELVAILIIMLVVAGPKRMIQWAYILGQYMAKARRLWSDAMTAIEKDLQESGMDVNLPKDIPTRNSLNQQMSQVLNTVAQPGQVILKEVQSEVNDLRTAATIHEIAE